MKVVNEYLNEGDTVKISDTIHSKKLGESGRFSAICSGSLIEHMVVRQTVRSPADVEFPDGSTVLGIELNQNRADTSFVWLAIPKFKYGDSE